jgi:hypothetical protein
VPERPVAKSIMMKTVRDTAVERIVNESRRPLALLGVSFVLVMIDGYDLFIVSFLAPLIAKDLHLNFVNIGTVFAAGLADIHKVQMKIF